MDGRCWKGEERGVVRGDVDEYTGIPTSTDDNQ